MQQLSAAAGEGPTLTLPMPTTSHPQLYAPSAYFVPFFRVSEPMQCVAYQKFYLANAK